MRWPETVRLMREHAAKLREKGADPAFVPTASSQQVVSTKGFNPGDGPPCGPAFSPEDGCYECWFCGRPPHRECTAYYPEDEQ